MCYYYAVYGRCSCIEFPMGGAVGAWWIHSIDVYAELVYEFKFVFTGL